MPRLTPLLYGAARGGGHCHERQAPPIRARLGSGRSGDPVSIRRSCWGEITSLTNVPALHMTTLYCSWSPFPFDSQQSANRHACAGFPGFRWPEKARGHHVERNGTTSNPCRHPALHTSGQHAFVHLRTCIYMQAGRQEVFPPQAEPFFRAQRT
jgi:hypothetical protein